LAHRAFVLSVRCAVALVAAVAAASCSSHSDAPPPETSTIQLVQSPWGASRIDAAIARILLTEQLHYDVAVTELDEYAQWDVIASGKYHASLEVWPSGHAADIAKYVDPGLVEDLGQLGPIGKIGWYIPSYMLETHPELASVGGFATPAAAALFATPQTAPNGRFVAGDPSWTQYDADIIRNNGLAFTVVYSGSEDAEIALLADAYAKRDPILMYLWTPQWALAKYDMTQVKLKAYSADCYAKEATHGIDCDYPTDALFKIGWPGLASSAPRAYSFLRRFQYTTSDQIQLLAAVHQNGMTVDQAARAWVDANPSIWQTWIGP
jgi:glycine betaine/proline transport system substrate-binding protein